MIAETFQSSVAAGCLTTVLCHKLVFVRPWPSLVQDVSGKAASSGDCKTQSVKQADWKCQTLCTTDKYVCWVRRLKTPEVWFSRGMLCMICVTWPHTCNYCAVWVAVRATPDLLACFNAKHQAVPQCGNAVRCSLATLNTKPQGIRLYTLNARWLLTWYEPNKHSDDAWTIISASIAAVVWDIALQQFCSLKNSLLHVCSGCSAEHTSSNYCVV